MKANRAFFFAYPNGFGDVKLLQEVMNVDFQKYEGHGIVFRNNVDFKFSGEKKLFVTLMATEEIELSLEFKTEASGGCADTQEKILLHPGKTEFVFDIPETFSPIREICFAALRSKNDEHSKTSEYGVISFEIK